MAITKTITLKNGLTAKDAYIRIDTLQGSKVSMAAAVDVYLSEDAFRGRGKFTEMQPALQREFVDFVPDVAPEAEHFLNQAYAFIKAMPDYKGGVDA